MYCFECTSVLRTLCIAWCYHALVFLAHYVLFEISLTNFEALSIQVNALNSIRWPLTLILHDFNKSATLKKRVTGWRSQNQWWLLSASIWYQSLGWWWRWFNIWGNLFLTRMSHHLVKLFASMKCCWFRQRIFSNWVEQDLSYNRWCLQHGHLVVSWLSCLNYLLVEQAVVHPAAAIHECEHNSMDFNPNVKFQVSWDNTQYILKLYHHKDQSILDPRNTLHLLPC